MSLWKRTDVKSKDAIESERLCKRRDKLQETWPAVEAKWNEIDTEQVEPAAQRLSTVLLTQNPEKILAAREVLKIAIWDRDAIKERFQRQLAELNGDNEMLTNPVISAKCLEWQRDLSALRGQKIVECVERFADMRSDRTPQMVKYRSNHPTIAAAKETLGPAIRELREMRGSPLSAIYQFIESIEAKLKNLDFSALTEAAEPVSETVFSQIIAEPELEVRPARGSTDRFAERFFRA